MESSSVHIDSIEQHHTTRSQIENSMAGALAYIRTNFRVVEEEKQIRRGGWSQFIHETNEPPSATGTASLLIAMLNCGESPSSEVVSLCRDLIKDQVRPDGGWSKPSLQKVTSLTRETTFSLKALLDSGSVSTSPEVSNGTRWILNAQNEDGGWGNTAKDNKSDVTSTSYCIQILMRLIDTASNHTEIVSAVRDGHVWLGSVKNDDCSWGKAKGYQGTLAHTSHAVDALVSCGLDPQALILTRKWLLNNLHLSAQFVEHYLVPIPGQDKERLVWTQLPDERVLIALLKLGVGGDSAIVRQLSTRILSRQQNTTYWKIDGVPDAAPSWAIMEAVMSLREFLDHLERYGSDFAFADAITKLQTQLDSMGHHIQELEQRLTNASLKHKLKTIRATLSNPIWLISIISLFLVIGYLFVRAYLQLPSIADTIVGVIGIISLFVSLYGIASASKQRRDDRSSKLIKGKEQADSFRNPQNMPKHEGVTK